MLQSLGSRLALGSRVCTAPTSLPLSLSLGRSAVGAGAGTGTSASALRSSPRTTFARPCSSYTHAHAHAHTHTNALSQSTRTTTPRRLPSLTAVPRFSRAVGGTGGSLVQTRGMKVRSSVKKFCDGCSVVRRKGRLYVICSKDPKHKQRQG